MEAAWLANNLSIYTQPSQQHAQWVCLAAFSSLLLTSHTSYQSYRSGVRQTAQAEPSPLKDGATLLLACLPVLVQWALDGLTTYSIPFWLLPLILAVVTLYVAPFLSEQVQREMKAIKTQLDEDCK